MPEITNYGVREQVNCMLGSYLGDLLNKNSKKNPFDNQGVIENYRKKSR